MKKMIVNAVINERRELGLWDIKVLNHASEGLKQDIGA